MAEMSQAMEVGESVQESQDASLCTECGERPGEIQRLKKLCCGKCWIHHCNFRFRKRLYELGKPPKDFASTSASLGSSMSMLSVNSGTSSGRPDFPVENVLVDYDPASEHSIVLLHLLRDAIVDNLEALSATDRPKILPFPFTFTIIFISAGVHENGEINLNKKDNIRVKNFETLKSWFKETKIIPNVGDYFSSIIVASIEESLAVARDINMEFKMVNITEQPDMQITFPFNGTLHENLVSVVENLKTKTSRIDFLQILRCNLLDTIALRLGQTKILVVEDQTNLAIKMFTLMSVGRGAQLANQMEFITKGVHASFVKPMIDLSCDDLRDYIKSMQMIELSKAEPTKNVDHIQAQCEDFIKTLQRQFPATVPTLAKIGTKLEPPPSTASTSLPCIRESSPRTDFVDSQPTTQSCNLCKNEVDNSQPTPFGGGKSLCYACCRIVQEMKTPNLLLDILK